MTKELRGKEIAGKDHMAYLKAELDEAKERKKVGMAEREQIRKGMYACTCMCVHVAKL